jgi:predicted phosphoribosyltransferase
MAFLFRDRRDAGRQLSSALRAHNSSNVVVLGIPAGGVPVAYEIAREMGAPLDVFVMRKLLAPRGSDAALGALGSGGVRLLNRDLIYGSRIPPEMVDDLTRIARAALIAEECDYRDEVEHVCVRGRPVILVDDGTAGLDVLRISTELLRELDAERVIVAVPAMARGQVSTLKPVADDVVTISAEELHDPARWYADFTMTTPGEVRALLALAEAERHARVFALAH